MSTPSLTLPVFVSLSSALTGVAANQLKPPRDPIGIADQYFSTLTGNVSASTLTSLAAAFQAVADPTQSAAQILADPLLSPVARSIMKMWLLGVWYNPANPTQAVNVISSQAYKESLIWKVMQAHPMGYSMFTFGSWAKPPPALSQFIHPAPATPASGN